MYSIYIVLPLHNILDLYKLHLETYSSDKQKKGLDHYNPEHLLLMLLLLRIFLIGFERDPATKIICSFNNYYIAVSNFETE